MPLLKFEVQADYDKVIKLKEEIDKLQQSLLTLSPDTPTATISKIESKLASAKGEFDRLTQAAMLAGAELQDGFKKKIYDASQTVNGLTSSIIEQKEAVHGAQKELRDMSARYKELMTASKGKPTGEAYFEAKRLSEQIKEYNNYLAEEKDRLFNLNQEQSRAKLKVKELTDEYKSLQNEAGSTSEEIEAFKDSIKGMAKEALGIAGIGVGLKEIVGNIVNVRGEFEQLEVSFKTMLGNEQEANSLMQQLTKTAAITPFDLKGVADGAKQLLAYGTAANEVNGTLVRLGDIAAGLSIPLGDLVYLYGTTMTQGRMYTQDLRQFMGRGIPLAEELAKQFGVTKDKVGELVTAGKVGAEEFKKAIMSMTDAGGTFGGLMEAQSKTISGQISNIEDAIDSMFNDIGKNSEGIIHGSLDVVQSLIESYERVGRTLLSLVGTYGVYKTACIVATATTKGWTAAQMLQYNWLLLVEKAQKLLNATMLANPYVLAATALAGLITVIVSAKNETELLREAEENYNDSLNKVIEAEEKHKRDIEDLCSVAGDEMVATDLRREALYKLEKQYPAIFAKYETEYEMLKNIANIKREIAELDGKKSITNPEVEIEKVNSRIKELEAKKATERWVDIGGHGAMSKIGGLSSKEEAELKMLQAKNTELQKAIRKNEVDNYILNLSEKRKDAKGNETSDYVVSDAVLSAREKQIRNLQAYMKMEKATRGRIVGGELDGSYTMEELNAMLQSVQREQTRRNTKGKSSATILSDLKKDYDKATKAYNDFVTNKSNELTKTEFAKKAKELKDARDAAKKEYDSYKPKTDTKAANQQKKQENAQEKLNRAVKDLEDKNQKTHNDLLLEGREKRLAIIEQEYNDRKKAIERQKEDWKKANKEAKMSGLNADGLTSEQEAALKKSEELAEKQRQKSTADVYKDEAAAMRDYLKQYGTYQQQKLAIAQEYAEKIKKAQTEGEKLSLAKERDAATRQVDINAIKSEIDWRGLFSGVGNLVSDQLKPMLDRLNEFTKSEEFAGYTLEEQQQVYDWINQLNERIGVDLKDAFENVGAATAKYQQALKDEDTAKKAAAKATNEYNTLLEEKGADGKAINPDDPEIKAAWDKMQKASSALATATNNVATSLDKVQQAAQNARDGMNNIVDGLKGLSSGSVSGAMDGLSKFLKAFKGDDYNLNEAIAKGIAGPMQDFVGMFSSKAGKAVGDALGGPIGGEIVEMAFQLLDIMGAGIENLVSSLIDTVLNAVNGLLNTFLSLDFPTKVGESLMNGLKGIANTLTFGGFDSWFGSKESDKNYERDMELLTASNEKLTSAIDRLKDTMEDSTIMEAADVFQNQEDFLRALESNLSEQVQRSGTAYKSDNIFGNGGHDSGTYFLRQMSQSKWQDIAKLLGKEGEWGKWLSKMDKGSRKSLADAFLKLSAEDMRKVADQLPEIWIEINEALSKGYKDATEYLEQYISLPDQAKEIEEAWNQKLTDTTFDSVSDSFKSMLLDMESDSEDFAADFEKMMQQAIVNSMMSEKYNERLKAWYQNFSNAMSDTTLTSSERDDLQNEYNSIVEDALRERDALKSAFGWGSETESQNATGGYSTQLSEDTGSEIVGRMTAMQDALYRIEELGVERNQLLGGTSGENRQLSIAELTSSRIEQMMTQQAASYTVHVDSRRILAESYLELQQIRENTGAIVKPINSMKESLEKIEKNTKEMI